MKKLKKTLFPLFTLGAIGVFIPLQVSAQFDNSSVLDDVWAFSGDGMLASTSEPVAMVGILDFNQDANCAIATTINVGGTSWTTTATQCTFNINPGGRGSLTLELAPGPVPLPSPLEFALVVVDDDDEEEIRAIGTGDVVINIVAKEQDDEDDIDD